MVLKGSWRISEYVKDIGCWVYSKEFCCVDEFVEFNASDQEREAVGFEAWSSLGLCVMESFLIR
jgi:hypothetical protein